MSFATVAHPQQQLPARLVILIKMRFFFSLCCQRCVIPIPISSKTQTALRRAADTAQWQCISRSYRHIATGPAGNQQGHNAALACAHTVRKQNSCLPPTANHDMRSAHDWCTCLALQNQAEVLAGSTALAGQHLMLHPVHGPRKPADELLQLRGPQPKERAALMQPVSDEPAAEPGKRLTGRHGFTTSASALLSSKQQLLLYIVADTPGCMQPGWC